MTLQTPETAANVAITLGTRLQSWSSEISRLEDARKVSPLSKSDLKKLQDLNSSVDSYSQLLEGLTDLPMEPWIARVIRAA